MSHETFDPETEIRKLQADYVKSVEVLADNVMMSSTEVTNPLTRFALGLTGSIEFLEAVDTMNYKLGVRMGEPVLIGNASMGKMGVIAGQLETEFDSVYDPEHTPQVTGRLYVPLKHCVEWTCVRTYASPVAEGSTPSRQLLMSVTRYPGTYLNVSDRLLTPIRHTVDAVPHSIGIQEIAERDDVGEFSRHIESFWSHLPHRSHVE